MAWRWHLERPKHVATPNVYFNTTLVLCVTDSSVDILLLQNTTGWTTLRLFNLRYLLYPLTGLHGLLTTAHNLFMGVLFNDAFNYWDYIPSAIYERVWHLGGMTIYGGKSIYSMILPVLDPRKCEYLKHYSLDFEHAYMTTYLASW
jgi:hypothetical protein